MSRILRTEPTEIKKFILNAAIAKQPVFESYKKLREIQKNRKIDYVDFEWRYYQFYHGNRDLSIEKSSENSSSLTFSDLPMDVLEKVVDMLELIDRLIVRKVCRPLRNLVDDAAVFCEKVHLLTDSPWKQIQLGNWTIAYDSVDGDCTLTYGPGDRYTFKELKTKGLPRNSDMTKIMLDDMSTYLKNPKLRIGRFDIELDGKSGDTFIPALISALNFEIHAEEVCFEIPFYPENAVFSILKRFDPETLKTLRFLDFVGEEEGISIFETQQWKKAEIFYSENFEYYQIGALSHFKQFHIKSIDFNQNMLKAVRDFLIKSSHFESCSLGHAICRGGGGYDLEMINAIMSQDPTYDAETRRFPILNSQNEYLQLEYVNDYCLTITKSLVN